MGLPAGLEGVAIRGIEVTQTVQDLLNSVVLIADKPTVARVYIDPTTVTKAGTVSGEIAWRSDGAAGVAFQPAMNSIRLDPTSPRGLATQRSDLTGSLNFLLPAEAITAGQLEISVKRVSVVGGSELSLAPSAPAKLTFLSSPPLRVRVIGLRYQTGNPPTMVTPASVHFAYFKSFLARAYPVSTIEWSQIAVDADFVPPFDADASGTAVLANAQIAALRSREVSSGVDPRTHYFGLVDDNNGARGFFMRGRAFTIPERAQPDTVASAPCGVPRGFAGDTDASYADWYGGHELGHTFGRYHPGFPPGAQDASDAAFPYPEGLLSTADGRYVGFDMGDVALKLPMAVFSGSDHHDVMTYADNQWVSAYTYDAIFRRLTLEDKLVA